MKNNVFIDKNGNFTKLGMEMKENFPSFGRWIMKERIKFWLRNNYQWFIVTLLTIIGLVLMFL